MSIGIRLMFLVLATVYTGWSMWIARMVRRSFVFPTGDNRLQIAARHHRLVSYLGLLPRFGICLFFWTFAIFSPLAHRTLILLASPIGLSPLFLLGARLAWRQDFRLLRGGGPGEVSLVRFRPWLFVSVPHLGELDTAAPDGLILPGRTLS